MEGCLAEAARGLVSSFADVGEAESGRTVAFAYEPGPASELLVELLDEVVFVVDAEDAVPVRVSLARSLEGGLTGEFGLVERASLPVIGPAPKAVTRHDLRFWRADDCWRCEVVVDV